MICISIIIILSNSIFKAPQALLLFPSRIKLASWGKAEESHRSWKPHRSKRQECERTGCSEAQPLHSKIKQQCQLTEIGNPHNNIDGFFKHLQNTDRRTHTHTHQWFQIQSELVGQRASRWSLMFIYLEHGFADGGLRIAVSAKSIYRYSTSMRAGLEYTGSAAAVVE